MEIRLISVIFCYDVDRFGMDLNVDVDIWVVFLNLVNVIIGISISVMNMM